MKLKREYIINVIIVVAISMSILFFIKPINVVGSSMDATLQDGDMMIMSRQSYKLFGKPMKNDIIVFPYKDSYSTRLFVKRVIATEGELLEIKDNKVKINGVEQKEDYIGNNETKGNIKLKIPENEVFVMGDNRENSTDSRNFGTVSVKDISGKVIFRLFPFKRFGGVE